MSDKQDADKNETRLPHLLNPHKIERKQAIKLVQKSTLIEEQKRKSDALTVIGFSLEIAYSTSLPNGSTDQVGNLFRKQP